MFKKYFKNINTDVFFISIVSFCMSCSSSIIISCALDFSKTLNTTFSVIILGRVLGEVSGYLGKFIFSFLSDFYTSRRNFLLLCYGSVLVTKPIFIFSSLGILSNASSVVYYTIANIGDKFFGSVRDPIRDAWISEKTQEEHIKENFLFRVFFSILGTISGALISYMLINKITFTKLFLISFSISLIGLKFLYINIHDNKIIEETSKTKDNNLFVSFYKHLIKSEQSTFVIYLIAMIVFLYLGKVNEFSLWVMAKNIGIQCNNTLLFMLFYVSSIVASIIISYFSKYNLKLLFISSLILIINNIMIKVKLSLLTLILATLSYGLYSTILNTLSSISILYFFRNSRWKSTALSSLNLVIGISYLISGIIQKIIIDHYDSYKIFDYSIVSILLSYVFMYYLYFNRKKINL